MRWLVLGKRSRRDGEGRVLAEVLLLAGQSSRWDSASAAVALEDGAESHAEADAARDDAVHMDSGVAGFALLLAKSDGSA